MLGIYSDHHSIPALKSLEYREDGQNNWNNKLFPMLMGSVGVGILYRECNIHTCFYGKVGDCGLEQGHAYSQEQSEFMDTEEVQRVWEEGEQGGLPEPCSLLLSPHPGRAPRALPAPGRHSGRHLASPCPEGSPCPAPGWRSNGPGCAQGPPSSPARGSGGCLLARGWTAGERTGSYRGGQTCLRSSSAQHGAWQRAEDGKIPLIK